MRPLPEHLKAFLDAARPPKDVDNTMKVSDNLEAVCKAAKCPLNDRQIMLIRGSLMVWLPKLADEANRDLLDAIDNVMKRHAR